MLIIYVLIIFRGMELYIIYRRLMKKQNIKRVNNNSRSAANISKIGNFNRTSHLHSSYVHDNFAIICQGDQSNSSMIQQFCEYIKQSLEHYLTNIVSKLKPEQRLSASVHKRKISNFLVSCREQMNEKKVPGYISFCFYYKIDSCIFCIRSQGVEVYIIDVSKDLIKPISNSTIFPFHLKQNAQLKGYFYTGMTKVKNEYLFEDYGQQSMLFFQCYNFDAQNQNLRLLLGSSECFSLLTPDYIKKHFQSKQKSLSVIASALLEQVKKKWRKIYQKDVTFICSYV